MPLPPSLQNAIQNTFPHLGLNQLIEARKELSDRYRDLSYNQQFMTTEAQRHSYVLTRMPATFGAISQTLKQIIERDPSFEIKSMLDLGAGPGTAMWAVVNFFQKIERLTLIEKDSSLITIGKQLAQQSEDSVIQNAHWIQADLESGLSFVPHDLVMMSYSIGELNQNYYEELLNRCWESTQKVLIIIEPGTPAGFERIRYLRKLLLAKGAHILAPCTHHNACPMIEGDWCHFSVRVERTSLHRQLKSGRMGYEDEKFSYIAVSKSKVELLRPFCGRVLRHPEKHSGHIKFKLCQDKGLDFPIISKKMGSLYKKAKKTEWGDLLDHSGEE